MKLRSVMHSFNRVPSADIQRSSFDRSHGYKTTFDAGYLIPIYVDEALPGDTFNLDMTGFARLATPLDPVMDNMYIETFFFAVPNRLLWDNWEKFNGAQDNPDDSTDFLIPQMVSPSGGYASSSLSDYFGIPTGLTGLSHSSLWHRAYNLIYNEWFRDENLQDSLVVDKDDGPDNPADYVLQRRGKRQDYFTGCLPWPQKGDSVDLPLGSSAPIVGIYGVEGAVQTTTASQLRGVSSVFDKAGGSQSGNFTSAASNFYVGTTSTGAISSTNRPNIYADLSAATASTVNQLRQAFQVQKMLERDARGGTRYVELLKSHFGVTSPDFRLQRPEYLGGGSSPVNIQPVSYTALNTASGIYAGDLGAIGTAVMNRHGFSKSFVEHCTIIGVACVRADLTYQQGLDRMFSRQTRYDFYWPSLATIGEQAVLNKEIYAQATSADDEVFGYQERYAEYRYKPSRITGKMRSSDPLTLDTWHLSQQFGSLPVLDSTFIEENPPIDRVISIVTEPHFIFDSYFNLRCARPMPMFGVPGLIDHF